MGRYNGILRAAIHRCKFRDRPQLAEPLGCALADYAQTQASSLNGLKFDAVVPVPMNAARRRVRGYNQAERIATALARELELPLETQLLRRARRNRAQVGLSADERRENLRGSFSVTRPDLVQDRIFLVVDDVTTTGSTLHECAKALREAGAKAVYCLTLAAG
jgi:ComF family protein